MRIHSIFVICLLPVLWTMAGIPVKAGPIAEFKTTSFDIGNPIEGEKVKAVFQVKNTGDADLEILKVTAGCGCTQAKATQSKIPPGKVAAVEAVFNTTGFRNQVRKHITVTTNDPAHQTVELKIGGAVVPIADLKPQPFLNLRDLAPGAVSLSEIIIIPNIKQPFCILRVQSTGELASVLEYDKKKNRAGNYVLKIRVTAGSFPGRFYEQLSIVTDLPGNRVITFSIYGNVVSNAAAQGDKTK